MKMINTSPVPCNPVTALFPDSARLDAALGMMRQRALAAYPAERARIERGYSIALTGGVELLPDGTAMVQSQSHKDQRYAVRDACPCADASWAPAGHCKHVWTRCLARKAHEWMHAHAAEWATYQMDMATQPTPFYSEEELEAMTAALETYEDARAPGQTLAELASAWKR